MSTPYASNRYFLLPILAAALCAGCGKHEPPAAPATTDATPAAPKSAFVSKVPHAFTVDVAFGGPETQQPLPLSDGGTVAGQLVTTSAGSIVGISVVVGNYRNGATGALDVNVCIAERCSKGTVDTATSIDNEKLELALASPLAPVAGDVVTYTFSRPVGSNRIALWTYSAPTATDHLVAPADTARTPKISLLLN